MPVHVQCGEQEQDLSLLSVQEDGLSLLGHIWFSKICLHWAQIAYHKVPKLVPPVTGLQVVHNRYKEVLKYELGTTVKNIAQCTCSYTRS